MSREEHLMVGCPVRDRAWILPQWFEHLAAAMSEYRFEPHLVFVGDPHADRETFRVIDRECLNRSWDRDVIVERHPGAQAYERVWDLPRYEEMTRLRNTMLGYVRDCAPALFWSVDSDILLHPLTLRSAREALKRFDAVGSKCFMTPWETTCPSFAMLNGGGLLRWDDQGCFPVDVIMALKLMTPAAYAVDYEVDSSGEDIGWSNNARSRGLKLGWDGSVCSKHVMRPEDLDQVDHRCGF